MDGSAMINNMKVNVSDTECGPHLSQSVLVDSDVTSDMSPNHSDSIYHINEQFHKVRNKVITKALDLVNKALEEGPHLTMCLPMRSSSHEPGEF